MRRRICTGNRRQAMNSTTVDSVLLERVLRGYRTGAHVRTRLPAGGLLNIDRKLPFLLVYRQPDERADAGTAFLITGESSYLIARGETPDDLRDILLPLARAAMAELGSFLILEVWAGDESSREFVVHAPAHAGRSTVDVLCEGLRGLAMSPLDTTTTLRVTDDRHPADMPALLDVRDCWDTGCLLIGLQIPPLHHAADGTVYPVFLRRMRALLSPILRQTAYEFARVQTTASVESYRALGPRRFGRELFDADRALADIESSFEFLLLVSPVNANEAWRAFRDSHFERTPEFHYRLLPVDPDLLKRSLYALELERIADPAMASLLRDKREELDRQITMLAERNTDDFRLSSMKLYSPVDDVLLVVARSLLEQVHASRRHDDDDVVVDAREFARLARTEIEHYRAAYPALAAEVQTRPDLVGLMVSRGNLLIGERLALHPSRVEALLHHEVGTHVLTYYNGLAQPLTQFATGLAHYDELQEGLAVTTEYLAGGLDASRMRTLAARVLAVHSVESGADYMETFRMLTREYGFYEGTAFDIAERVHASGGFTRDVIYLRGVVRLLEYLRAGGDLEPLFIGKIAARHTDIVAELREREFLCPPALTPRVLRDPAATHRLDALRTGISLTEMVAAR
jgi:uncharacterized protein (TIGR02421 family)